MLCIIKIIIILFTYCSVIDQATQALTQTAITVTAIFFVTFGFPSWYYLLANVGTIEYKLNSPAQKMGQYDHYE